MNIVLEGPDNAGKSTLAQRIASVTNRIVIPSEGREKFPGEINERIRKYRDHIDVIFDRHPVVSQGIYHLISPNTRVDIELEQEFYNTRPLFIYCRSDLSRGMEGHVAKAHDDEEYLKEIENKFRQLIWAYDEWAFRHANFLYRIGDDIPTIIKAVQGVVA